MRNLKTKKRLAYSTVAFLLTFLVGAAFAIAGGVLSIEGTVNLNAPIDSFVVWTYVSTDELDEDFEADEDGFDPSTLTGHGYSYSVEQTAVVDDDPYQTIFWDMNFTLDFDQMQDTVDGYVAVASIVAVARNQSPIHSALVNSPVLEWDDDEDSEFTYEDFGLTLDILDNNLTGVLTPGAFAYLRATVIWNPSDISSEVLAHFEDDGEIDFTGTFSITLAYEVD